jgi:hypothetical protein
MNSGPFYLIDMSKMSEDDFRPRLGIMTRYAATEEAKQEAADRAKYKAQLLDRLIQRGHTREQAELQATRIMYLPGFSGPTFTE